MPVDQHSHVVRFGTFELDLRARELHKNGLKIPLPEQSIQILAMLLERSGEVVTRDEIQARLWPDDTIVEFDHSINAAVKRLRQALGDSADNPRYVETLARRGYRFIAVGPGLVPGLSPADAASAAVGGLQATTPSHVPGVAVSPADPASAAVGHPQGVPLHEPAGSAGQIREPSPSQRWSLRLAGMAAVLLVGMAVGWFVWHRIEPRTGQVAPGTIRSLAVLPLENLSGDPQQEYFADGMTDALIADLGQIARLRVISRTSVMRYKGTKKSLPEIAGELNVDAVAEGSVIREGGRVRITAQLIEAKTDRHLWAHSYDRGVTSVLALQGEVAQAIANEIQISVTPEEQARLASARPVNPEAHELYLRGWYFWSKAQAPPDVHKAIDYFLQAIDKDPSYALAHAGLAAAYNDLGEGQGSFSSETFSKAKTAAARAVELDDGLAEGHAELAHAVLALDWDWAKAEREFKRALELNPNSAVVHAGYAAYLAQVGRLPQAVSEAKQVRWLDPLRLWRYVLVGLIYYDARQYDQALEETRKALELDPKANVSWLRGFIYREKGMSEKAIREFQRCGDNAYMLAHLGNAYARAGRAAEARETISKLRQHIRTQNVTYGIALVYAGLGEKDEAFAWLEKAYQVRDKGLTFLKVDPCLDPLRSDPRFQDLLRRVGLPP
jgi:TolB-like protein/DNA-binding winged helix-turn-helix (wHTH) protein/Tfp pilus assembly protein PilF